MQSLGNVFVNERKTSLIASKNRHVNKGEVEERADELATQENAFGGM